MGWGPAALSQEPYPRFWPFGLRFYWSQGLTHYRVDNPTNDSSYFFQFSENGENGLGDEGADEAMPPRIFGLELPLSLLLNIVDALAFAGSPSAYVTSQWPLKPALAVSLCGHT